MKSRPRNIDLATLSQYRFPLTAIASILHRISGVLLFLFIPFLLWMFSQSLDSQYSFAQIQSCFGSVCARLLIWIFLSALLYHLIAGIKHLLMDIGFFESEVLAKSASMVVMILAAVMIVLAGVWLW